MKARKIVSIAIETVIFVGTVIKIICNRKN